VRPLAVVGNLSRDVVDGGAARVGGGAYYGARALRALGRAARVATSCAEADRDALLPAIVALGVPVAWRPGEETTSFAFRYEGERRLMRIQAIGHAWSPEDVRAAGLGSAGAVHVAPLLRSDFPAETLAELARGRRLSLDGQGLVRPARTGPLELDTDFDPKLLEHVSILKLAEEEAEALLGTVTAGSVSELGVPEVVVTHGPRGAVVFAGRGAEEVPAHAVAVADPTGAGDAFATGYLAARSAGLAPGAAARLATGLVESLLSGHRR
jgi:sugar/nucleoside kinase (ribokinase family)